MIWKELWWYVLAVRYRQELNARWVAYVIHEGPSDDVHRAGCLHRVWGPAAYATCACPKCMAEFDYAFELIEIGG